METGYKVGDAMTFDPVVVGDDQTIRNVVKVMNKKKVGSVVIKSGNGVGGIFTERNLIVALDEGKDIDSTKIVDVMSSPVVTVEPDLDIYGALKLMRDKNIRRLAVVHNSKLVGLITMKDILKLEPQLFDILVDKIHLREQERKLAEINEDNN